MSETPESIYCPKCTCQRCSCKGKPWKRVRKSELKQIISEAMFNNLADQGLLGLYLAGQSGLIEGPKDDIL